MSVKLTALDPHASDVPPGCDGAMNFLCPLCRKGRVSVWLVVGGEPRNGAHVTNVLPPAWDQMTITPSIADEGKCTRTARGCPGWHGFITNGEVTP
ncbi:hypothetical protein [Phenylobacterium soli]|uniref:Uncharacterized protein n=1 Tax=Phenylobacterium soli TaxID=2170551 RepID=A0A328AAI8_9CAUL|nr:hypothetical protein [Phenylobacterium soli]RAK51621.1 hypothetical protein DJ017_17450 [Phenylobacterium soli]